MMELFTGNTVEIGGAPVDIEEVLVCPSCLSWDVFETSNGAVCKECWYKAPASDFVQDKAEYYP